MTPQRLKIAYFGPALSGKTTNLQYVFAKSDPSARTAMESLATETSRILHFTVAATTLPVVVDLFCVVGAGFYDVSRSVLLDGVDGVIFVADSQVERLEANVESIAKLRSHLAPSVPIVLQYNKRDLPSALPIEELDRALGATRLSRTLAVAARGEGVFASLRECAGRAVGRISGASLDP